VRISELNKVNGDLINLESLIESNIVPVFTKKVKLIKSGAISRSVTVKGILVTEGAKAVIVAAGGKVEA
jgi:large subunit ribosomal protein L15